MEYNFYMVQYNLVTFDFQLPSTMERWRTGFRVIKNIYIGAYLYISLINHTSNLTCVNEFLILV